MASSGFEMSIHTVFSYTGKFNTSESRSYELATSTYVMLRQQRPEPLDLAPYESHKSLVYVSLFTSIDGVGTDDRFRSTQYPTHKWY